MDQLKKKKKKKSRRRKSTVETTELDGVGCNKLCGNTTPIATTNNGDLIHDDVNFLDFKHKL